MIAAGVAPAHAQDRPQPVSKTPVPAAARPGFVEVTPESRAAIRRGLDHLAHTQQRTGSWAGGEYEVAVTSLCGLALLAGGSTATSGPHAEQVRKAMNYVCKNQLRSGLICAYATDSRPMYGHGFALLFLAECWGMSGPVEADRPLDRTIRDAVKLVAESQTEAGGWYYMPTRDEDEGSVTITQIQGLRAARNAGFRVERRVIDRALDYIRASQDRDGGIKYTSRYGRSSLALTGAGLSVLFGAGEYDSKAVRDALAYVKLHMETGPETPHFNYTHFYLAQALHQQGGAWWEDYFPRVRGELVRTQASNGSWSSTYGPAYATALSLLVLEIPLRYLPIYER